MVALSVIQLACAAAFGVDLLLEFPDPRLWASLEGPDLVHLLSETVLLVMLVIGFSLARFALRQIGRERDKAQTDLRSLRGDFDKILHQYFDLWNLTPAQRDVALLTLRGETIAEIARARGCADGTVKAHLSAIFRAAGVGTRAGLVGFFMEEFLDHGATQAA